MDYDMAKSNAQSLADRWNKAVYIAKSYLTGDYCLLSGNKKLSITFRVVETVIPHTCKDGKRGQMNITTYKIKQYNATSKTVVCVNDKPVCMAVGGKTVSNIIAYLNGYNVDIADGKIKKALDRCKAESRKQKPCVDTVSRQAVSNFLEDHAKDFEDAKVRIAFKAASSLVESANNVPSVTPVCKKGRWIEEPNCWLRCSCCNSHSPCISIYTTAKGSKYCPKCGAEMENGVEIENR